MAITIVVENGTGLATANSYLTVAQAREFALNRGLDLTAKSDDAVAAMLFQAADWLEAKRAEYVGTETYGVATDAHPDVQALAWPRSVTDGCTCVLTDLGVPVAIRKAQGFLVMAVAKGYDLLPTTSASNLVKKKKVGDLEVEYHAAGELALNGPNVSAAEGFLEMYMREYAVAKSTGGLIVERV